jgi:ATP diphosphatase
MTKPDTKSAADALQRLIAIMAALRTPGTGCPWDLAQTFETIAPYTIEEAYEVADAIQRRDLADLKDELGDLLLQVVYHARMAEEVNAFGFVDVAEAVNAKMIRRHPHVFGTDEERAAGAQPDFWSRIKAEERAAKAEERAQHSSPGLHVPSAHGSSLLASVPATMPALTRAIKLQDKAASVGFDWPDLAPVLAKLKEEVAELEEALLGAVSDSPSGSRPETANNDGIADAAKQPHAASGRLPAGESDAAKQEELGDILFVLANVARHLKLDPETALRKANEKFTRRFAYIEQRLAEQGKTCEQSSLEEMDALWDEIRAEDKRQR